MSEIREARGGDGWSQWVIEREGTGRYFVLVESTAETNPDRSKSIIFVSDDISDGHAAIRAAISASAAYAHRMAS